MIDGYLITRPGSGVMDRCFILLAMISENLSCVRIGLSCACERNSRWKSISFFGNAVVSSANDIGSSEEDGRSFREVQEAVNERGSCARLERELCAQIAEGNTDMS